MSSSATSSSSSSTDTILKTLTTRGWCFNDVDQIRSIITVHSAIAGAISTVDSIESELCNIDLRTVGGKSLPDPSSLRKSSLSLHPPKLLQIASIRDISKSSVVEGGRSSSHRRLLKMILSDGHSEITAVEYSHIPSLPDDVVPGTKIRLEKKAVLHYGILCLTPDAITVLGGVVQSLYEEWQMNQKYSGFSRSSLRLGQGDAGGPPPFEKLQIGGLKQSIACNAPRNNKPAAANSSRDDEVQQVNQTKTSNAKANISYNTTEIASSSQRTEEKIADTRAKEVAEYVPIQNQAAAQKLLQKMNNPTHGSERYKGQRYRGRGKEEEKPVFTLDEWEKKKAGAYSVAKEPSLDVTRDEDLAWQLQNQFNLEDQEQWNPHVDKAEDLKRSMFSFDRDNNTDYGSGGSRGRGRGRGRGSGRGRGRGQGRGRGRG